MKTAIIIVIAVLFIFGAIFCYLLIVGADESRRTDREKKARGEAEARGTRVEIQVREDEEQDTNG